MAQERLPGRWALVRGDLAAAAAMALAVGAAALAGVFEATEEDSLDLRFRTRGPRPPRAPVAVVAIDEASLALLGQMPWSRKTFALLLDRLREEGAAAVAFDVAFAEPGRREAGEDEALRDAAARFGPVILPVFRPFQSGPAAGPALVRPVEVLAGAAWGFGLAHFATRPDLHVHQVEPQQPAGSALVPTLGLTLARAWLGSPAGRSWPGAAVPVPGYGDPTYLALDYLGPAGTVPQFPVIAVLDGGVPRGSLAGKAVLVGATAAGLPDTGFQGAFDGPYPGVELHATVAENILSAGGLRRLPGPLEVVGWAVLALTAGAWLAGSRRPPGWRLGGLFGSLSTLWGTAWGAFAGGWWLPAVAPSALLACCALAGILRQERDLLRERARLLGWYATELAREAKRQRELIDGELHDEAQQLLVVMSREARKLEKGLGEGRLGALPELLERTLGEIVRVRKALVPHTLSRQGLRAAAEEMVREAVLRGSAAVELSVDGWPDRVDPLLEEELFWLLKEALNNALEHAGAGCVRVHLGAAGSALCVEVADDGRGFTPPLLDRPPQSHEHTGLHRMWVRARGLGGRLVVDSRAGAGSRVAFQVPLAPLPTDQHPAP